MPKIIQATRKNKHGMGSPVMYIKCPDSGKEQSATCCDKRFCTNYEGRKEIVETDVLQIACGHKG